MIEAGIRTLFLAQSSITTLVPAQTIDTKSFSGVFVQQSKEGFKPASGKGLIVIERTGRDPMVALDGTYGMQSSDITVNCIAKASDDADAIANAVTDYFKDYTGAAGSDTIDAVIWTDSNMDDYPPPDGTDVPWKVVALEFTVQHHTT